jgi:hypothetical protein
VPVPAPPFWGAREIDVPLDEVYHHLDTHVLFKLHWGGRGVKGEEWRKLISEDFQPRLERMWREQDYLHPRALLGYFPATARATTSSCSTPRPLEGARAPRLPAPAQARPHLPWPTSTGRGDSDELDVVAIQAVTAGEEVTQLMGKLEADGEFAEQLFTHGLGVQTAEGMAEWLHAQRARRPRHPRRAGPALLVGLPACPDQSEHEKVFRLLDAPSIGLRLSGGYAVEPEQSTLAIVAHHPQAVYFGMKSGFLPKDERQARRRGDRRDRQGPGAAGRALRRGAGARAGPGRVARPRWQIRTLSLACSARRRAALDVVAQAPSSRLARTTLAERIDLEAVPGRLRDPVGRLVDGAEPAQPLPFAEVERVLRDAWRAKPSTVLAELERDPAAVRPGSQVHRGQDADGNAVAVKVLRPGLAAAVRADLALADRGRGDRRRGPAAARPGGAGGRGPRAGARRARPRVRGGRPAHVPSRTAPPRASSASPPWTACWPPRPSW